MKQGDNDIKIIVDNSHDRNIPPLSADFTFFGGIYRDVSLIITPDIHISPTHYATSGVYISTEDEDKKTAVANIRTYLSNGSLSDATVLLTHRIVKPDGSEACIFSEKVKLAAGSENICHKTRMKIENPELWNTTNPALYRIETILGYENGRKYDTVTNSFGIRWFRFDPEEGFFLNGRHTRLTGTNRHQDYYLKGNALNDEMHVRDIRLIKEMGGNFLRISHYPQDPVISQMCDRYGIVSSVEIPIVNAITKSEEFRKNCIEMTKEMIWQNFNSPSVIIWAYMNEVLLRPPYDRNNTDEKKAYMEYLYSITCDIENVINETDPDRYTMLPCHSNPKIYNECGISRLPDILGWNIYNGWYSDGLDGLGKKLDELHEMYPEQSLIITEYGADVDPRLHSFTPERFDFTCEYGIEYHSHYISEILSRKWLAGTTIWNLNDFYSESRRDAVPHVNGKGITSTDRSPKDTYYLYKTWLSGQPVLRIGEHGWKIRGGVADEHGECIQPVKVYTNTDSVNLYLNGKLIGTERAKENIAMFYVPFRAGRNDIRATAETGGKTLEDILSVDFRMIPHSFDDNISEFFEMNIMLGSRRYFEDKEGGMIWIPEQEYEDNGWGYIGGYAARTRTRHGSLPCAAIDILRTGQDPVYQTQRRNIEGFKADVPDGRYYVYLYFAELISGQEKETLAYNLGNDALMESVEKREFDVNINGITVLKNFDISEECGSETAVIKKFVVNSRKGEGLDIRFIKRKGEPVLNAIRIYKCF